MADAPCSELPFGVPFEGDAASLGPPSVWVAAADIAAAGGRIVATIERVLKHPSATMPDGRVLLNFPAVHFERGEPKPLVLTAVENIVPLATVFGRDVREWPGRRVVLYNARTQRGGVPCWGARVRPLRNGES
jgi:hypothetical protein